MDKDKRVLKLLHFFSSRTRVHFVRSILIPQKTKIDYYVATPVSAVPICAYNRSSGRNTMCDRRGCKVLLEEYSFHDVIKNHIFFNGKLIYYENFEKLKRTIRDIHFDAVLVSDVPTISTLMKVYNIFDYLPPIYFIPHGITVFYPTKNIFANWHPFITYFIVGQYQIKGLSTEVSYNGKTYNRRIFKLEGLPQFDYLFFSIYYYSKKQNQLVIRKELNIPVTGKFVLIISGIDGFAELLFKLIDLIHEILPHYYVVLRNKLCNYELPSKRYFDFVRQSSLSRTLYDYVFADINIVYFGGTSCLESLYSNARTIIYQADNNRVGHNELNIDTEKYRNLLITKRTDEFKKHINLVQSDYVLTEDYIKDIKSYSEEMCGSENISIVSDIILNTIRDDIEKKVYNVEMANELKHELNVINATYSNDRAPVYLSKLEQELLNPYDFQIYKDMDVIRKESMVMEPSKANVQLIENKVKEDNEIKLLTYEVGRQDVVKIQRPKKSKYEQLINDVFSCSEINDTIEQNSKNRKNSDITQIIENQILNIALQNVNNKQNENIVKSTSTKSKEHQNILPKDKIQKKIKPPIKPPTGLATEPTFVPPTKPPTEQTEQPTEPIFVTPTKPTIETTIVPPTKPTTEPTIETTIVPPTKPTIETTIVPPTKPTTEPTIETTIVPPTKPTIEPTIVSPTKPPTEQTEQPTEPIIVPPTEQTEQPTEPIIVPPTELTTEPTFVPPTKPPTEQTEQPTEPIIVPPTELTTEPTFVPPTKPPTEQTEQPTEPIIVPPTEPTTEPTIETTEPTIETTEPTIVPSTKLTTEPTIETTEPTIETTEPTIETTEPTIETTIVPSTKLTTEPTIETTIVPSTKLTTEPTIVSSTKLIFEPSIVPPIKPPTEHIIVSSIELPTEQPIKPPTEPIIVLSTKQPTEQPIGLNIEIPNETELIQYEETVSKTIDANSDNSSSNHKDVKITVTNDVTHITPSDLVSNVHWRKKFAKRKVVAMLNEGKNSASLRNTEENEKIKSEKVEEPNEILNEDKNSESLRNTEENEKTKNEMEKVEEPDGMLNEDKNSLKKGKTKSEMEKVEVKPEILGIDVVERNGTLIYVYNNKVPDKINLRQLNKFTDGGISLVDTKHFEIKKEVTVEQKQRSQINLIIMSNFNRIIKDMIYDINSRRHDLSIKSQIYKIEKITTKIKSVINGYFTNNKVQCGKKIFNEVIEDLLIKIKQVITEIMFDKIPDKSKFLLELINTKMIEIRQIIREILIYKDFHDLKQDINLNTAHSIKSEVSSRKEEKKETEVERIKNLKQREAKRLEELKQIEEQKHLEELKQIEERKHLEELKQIEERKHLEELKQIEERKHLEELKQIEERKHLEELKQMNESKQIGETKQENDGVIEEIRNQKQIQKIKMIKHGYVDIRDAIIYKYKKRR
jgi:hypothetical protein